MNTLYRLAACSLLLLSGLLLPPVLMAEYTGALPENSQLCAWVKDNPATSRPDAGFVCTDSPRDTTRLLDDAQSETYLQSVFRRWGETEPASILEDRKFTFQPALKTINAHYAYARGLSGRGVTVAIEDSGVDITSIDFFGKVQHQGAHLVYWRPLAFLRTVNAFSECTGTFSNLCRVFEVDAGGVDEKVQEFARHVIENQGYPSRNNRWFIRDTSQNGLLSWYEFPALYDEENTTGRHGTIVGSVAVGWHFGVAPEARIVPISHNFDEQKEIRFVLNNPDVTYPGLDHEEFDNMLATQINDSREHYDIINRSYGRSHRDIETHVQLLVEELQRWMHIRQNLPRYARALTQEDIPDAEKSIEVWATGNNGQPIPGPEAAFPLYERTVRGHVVAVTALGTNGLLANYANRCGYLPGNWDTEKHGRHYCLAAPGTVNAIAPGAVEGFSPGVYTNVPGTSFAAPMVSGALALVMQKFRQQLTPREIVLRVINTADNSGEYGKTVTASNGTVFYPYGAGVLDLKAATEPIGELQTGTQALQASLARSILAMPAAYGNVGRHFAGVEVAGFDDWNAPFWYDAGQMFSSFGFYQPLPLPQFGQSLEQSALLPYLRWHNVGQDRQDPTLNGMKLRMTATYASADAENHWSGWIYPTFGFSAEFQPGARAGFLVETDSHHGARPSGAFGHRVRSQLVWMSRTRSWDLDSAGRWQFELAGLVAAGQPDYPDGSMFHAGSALYSSGHLRLRYQAEDTQTAMTLSQPLRAESGTGTLVYPTGRHVDGVWQFAQQRFGLTPGSRELRLQLRHDRPLATGKLAMELTYAHNAGHIAGQSRTQLGLGYQLQW